MDGFRVRVTVSWPIWAGGYPTPEAVIGDIKENKSLLEALLNSAAYQYATHSDLGRISVEVNKFEIGDYNPMWRNKEHGLDRPNNTIILWLEFNMVDNSRERNQTDLTSLFHQTRGVIRWFFTRKQGGANAYDVDMAWGRGSWRAGEDGLIELSPAARKTPDETERPQALVTKPHGQPESTSHGLSPLQKYLLDQATYHAAKATIASVRKIEWVFAGVLLIFLYIFFVFNPRKGSFQLDDLILSLIALSTAIIFLYESWSERVYARAASAAAQELDEFLKPGRPASTPARDGMWQATDETRG
ncbi:hypothetical protein ACFQS7_22460 [Dankookia sp. GCM10030260]|uniref:hypothetical protein n=1 Tax=Dankookia sp. GCM10030260 TaxID=3273390 RepID=UPI00361D12CD